MFSIESFPIIAFTALITIVNPLGSLPPFLAMTVGESKRDKELISMRACLVAASTLIVCAAAGSIIFKVFGISLPAFKISGGILLFVVAFNMLQAQRPRTKSTPEENNEGASKESIAVFPLAIPLLSGPGSIASVFMLSEEANGMFQHASVYISIMLTMTIAYLILSSADRISAILGTIGINVLTRLMGLILAAIAVQFVLDGILQAFPSLAS